MQLPSPLGPNPSLPSPVGPLSGLAGIGVATYAPQKLTADVAQSAAAALALGFNAPVSAGVPTTIHARFFIVGAGAGGVLIRFVYPGGTGFLYLNANSTSTTLYTQTVLALTASPMLISGAVVTYVGNGYFDCLINIVPSSGGTIDFTIQPNVGGQLMTVKAGSYIEVIT